MTQTVLLLGSEPRVVVPVARRLARLGVRVTQARARWPPMGSRSISVSVTVPDADTEKEAFQERLVNLLEHRQFDVTIPLSDGSLAAVADVEDELRRRTILACPSRAVVHRVLDKALTMETADACGVPHPRQYEAPDRNSLPAWLEQLRFPVVAKVRTKLGGIGRLRWQKYDTPESLRREFDIDPEFGTKHLIQDYCPGTGVGLETVYWNGSPSIWFQHRRLQEYPPAGGAGVLAVAESPDPALTAGADRLLAALNWQGPAMVEFRQDLEHGTCYLMEVNGRYWGSLGLALAAGIDFPAYHWRLLHGEDPQVAAGYAPGVRARWTPGCIQRANNLLTGRSMLDLLGALGPGTADMLWSWRDPVPAPLEVLRALMRMGLRDARKLLRRAAPRPLRKAASQTSGFSWPEHRAYWRQYARAAGQRQERTLELGRTQSVLILCYGNIMRSPMAERLLVRHAEAAGLTGITVTSAGLAASDGRRAEPAARRVAAEFGVSLDGHRARSVSDADLGSADVILVMDRQNEAMVLARAPHAAPRVILLGTYLDTGSEPEIADPYGQADAVTRDCFERIDRAARAFAADWVDSRR